MERRQLDMPRACSPLLVPDTRNMAKERKERGIEEGAIQEAAFLQNPALRALHPFNVKPGKKLQCLSVCLWRERERKGSKDGRGLERATRTYNGQRPIYSRTYEGRKGEKEEEEEEKERYEEGDEVAEKKVRHAEKTNCTTAYIWWTRFLHLAPPIGGNCPSHMSAQVRGFEKSLEIPALSGSFAALG